jgi:hypothetical protein
MNGASADPPPMTIRIPSNNRTIIMGANQNFFLAPRNLNKSLRKSIFTILIEFKFCFPIINFFPCRLFCFYKQTVIYHQKVHFSSHKATVCILRSTNNRFTSHIEAGVYQHSKSGFISEFFEESVIFWISFLVYTLNTGRKIEVSNSLHIGAGNV